MTLLERLQQARRWLLEPLYLGPFRELESAVRDAGSAVLRTVERHAYPPPVINVLVFAGDKLVFGTRRSFDKGGEHFIRFQAFQPIEDVLIVCLCDLERVRVQSVFHGTELQHLLGDGMTAPICRIKGTVQAGVLLTVNAVMVEK